MRFEQVGTGLRACVCTLAVAMFLVIVGAMFADANAQSSVRPPNTPLPIDQESPVEGQVPGNTLGGESDSDIWRQIKSGDAFSSTTRDPNAGRLVQYEGQIWREIHNGAVPRYGAWAIIAVIVGLALLFALLGRVRIRNGWSGSTITRFTAIERTGHWLTAGSFVILALTGLNILYGRSVIMPVIGREAYAAIAMWGKYLHNYVAFAFIAGLILIFIHWVAHNIPNRHDIVWLAKGGGIIFKNAHVPARKFNAGQKVIFWLTILGGASVALSGWALLFPFTTSFMTHTFDLLARIGIDMPAMFGLPEPPYTAMMEQQMNQVWHSSVSLFLTAIIIAHIYIGTVGMEGAFQAMGTGEVDYNWAREHHNLWVAEVEERLNEKQSTASAGSPVAQEPAE